MKNVSIKKFLCKITTKILVESENSSFTLEPGTPIPSLRFKKAILPPFTLEKAISETYCVNEKLGVQKMA